MIDAPSRRGINSPHRHRYAVGIKGIGNGGVSTSAVPLFLARRFTAVQNFLNFVRLTPRFGVDENAAAFLIYNRVLGWA